MAKILSGTEVAAKVKADVKAELETYAKKGVYPRLDVVLVGEDPASQIYVRKKHEDCEEVGIKSIVHNLSENTTQDELIKLVEELNANDEVSGILVQLPLPKHIDSNKIIDTISPDKDVDAFHLINVGRIMTGDYRFLPCTPSGILEILKYYDIEIEGKNAVVVGRSNIVGKPMAMLLLHENATVTVAHSRTKDIAEHTKNADIIVVATGKAKMLKADMIKEGAVVIDVGMDRDENGKLCGDVDFDDVKDKAGYITPVPGGVGPMTRAILLKNTLKSIEGK